MHMICPDVKTVKRLWVSSLTKESIQNGWKNLRPSEDFDRLADAARCRSEADWLVGMNATKAMTCLVKNAGGDQLFDYWSCPNTYVDDCGTRSSNCKL